MLIIKKQTSKVVHGGAEAWDGVHPLCNTSDGSGWVALEDNAAVTCKKCLKQIEKAESLGLYLEVRRNEDGSGRVVDTRDEIAEQADAEAGELLDAVLGEYVEPIANNGQIAITKYSANEAIATAVLGVDSVGGSVTRERGRWVLRAEGRTIRAKTLGKVAKLWAKALGFRATISVETMS